MEGKTAEWHVESLRLSVFLVEQVTPEHELGRWAELMGSDPDETRTQHYGHVATADGPFGSGRLRLGVGASRFDWQVTPAPDETSTPFLSLGAYESVHDAFSPRMRAWLEQGCPPVQRIAYAPVLIRQMKSIAGANRYLADRLESLQLRDPDHTTDLEFRFNVRKQSDTERSIQINRLVTWSVVEVAAARVAIPPRAGPGDVHVGPSTPVCKLQMDLNSAPENTTPLAAPAGLFDELVSIAFELADREGRG